MKRLFYLLIGLVLLPALLYAQGTLSPKDINDNLTNNYYNKTASDARYATTTYGYSSAEVDILLAPKADKTYVNATDEAIISDNDSQDVQIESNRVAIMLKASQTDMDSAENAIQLILADDDSQDVTIEANKVGVASLEVGLQTHQNNPTGAHAATAISATWTNVQVSLDSIEATIQGIVVGSGFATEAWVNSTLETNFYTQAQTNATIEAAIAAIPTPSVNQTVTVTAGEALTAGQVVSLINESGTMKAYNIPPPVSTSPNGAESVFNAAATTYCSAVALDSTRFLVAYKDSDTYGRAIVGTVNGSSISWGSENTFFSGDVSSGGLSVCKLNTDKVLVALYDTATTRGYCRVLSISETTITENSATIFGDGSIAAYVNCTQIDTDKALIAWSKGGTTGECVLVTVSGTTPTANTECTFNAAATAYISVSALSSTSAIVAYKDIGNGGKGTAQILSISGTTITPGTEYVFENSAIIDTSCAVVDLTKAVITYALDAGGGKTLVATNSSGELSYGEAATFTDGQYNSTAKIDSTHVIIASQVAATDYGQSIIGTINGTGITLGTPYSYNAATTVFIYVCHLGNQKSVIVYNDDGNSNYGTAVVNTWATTSYASVSGISSGAYSSGSDAVVLISGVSDDQSGLITGSPYFLQSDFTIGTTPVSLAKYYNSSTATGEIKIGTAKSATELIIGIDYK